MPTLAVLAGPPDVLVLDCAAPGAEASLALRICTSASRQNVRLSGPSRVSSAEQLQLAVAAAPLANCWLFVGVATAAPWSWLPHDLAEGRLLLAHCVDAAALLSRQDFRATYPWVTLAVVSKAGMTPQEVGLFFPELLAELTTHCPTCHHACARPLLLHESEPTRPRQSRDLELTMPVDFTPRARAALKQILDSEPHEPEPPMRMLPTIEVGHQIVLGKAEPGDQIVDYEGTPVLVITLRISDHIVKDHPGSILDVDDTPDGPQLVLRKLPIE